MTVRERFEKVRREQRNRFSLRTRLTALVTVEMLVCILIAYTADLIFNDLLSIPWEVPLELELFCTCLLIGILVTSLLSRYFFNPIKKLRSAMDKVAEGDFEAAKCYEEKRIAMKTREAIEEDFVWRTRRTLSKQS